MLPTQSHARGNVRRVSDTSLREYVTFDNRPQWPLFNQTRRTSSLWITANRSRLPSVPISHCHASIFILCPFLCPFEGLDTITLTSCACNHHRFSLVSIGDPLDRRTEPITTTTKRGGWSERVACSSFGEVANWIVSMFCSVGAGSTWLHVRTRVESCFFQSRNLGTRLPVGLTWSACCCADTGRAEQSNERGEEALRLRLRERSGWGFFVQRGRKEQIACKTRRCHEIMNSFILKLFRSDQNNNRPVYFQTTQKRKNISTNQTCMAHIDISPKHLFAERRYTHPRPNARLLRNDPIACACLSFMLGTPSQTTRPPTP